MSSEWVESTLGDVLTLQRGFDLPESSRIPGTFPIVASNGEVGSHNEAPVRAPGVVIGRSGSLGGAQFLTKDFWPLNTTLWVKDFKGNDARFCYFLLKWLDLGRFNSGSGVPTLNRNHVHPLPVRVPSAVSEQRAIAQILGTLDDKIQLNRRTSETLEAMARALFKSWFVDFDPVTKKQAGTWRKGESLPGLPAHLYDLFPDRFVESELDEIPGGWRNANASELFDVGIGRTPPRKEAQWFTTDGRDVRWLSIKDLGTAQVFAYETSERLTAAALERFRIRRIPKGIVVLSFKLTVGRVAITGTEMVSNEAIANFQPKRGTYLSSEFLFSALKHFNFERLGSTSSIATAVNSESIRGIPLLVPPKPLHDAWSSHSKIFFERLSMLQSEVRALSDLRNTLLPKLISGELRVKDAERFAEAA